MSLSGMMRTGTSGMNAQANRLSTVSENIANSNTTGYKKAMTEFSSLLLPSGTGEYNSGAMTTDVRYNITDQGALNFTSSATDLAIEGNGFFVVQDDTGTPFLTRAGSFTPDGDGYLVNSGGYRLLGADYTSGTPVPVVNGFDGLKPVKVSGTGLSVIPSTEGSFTSNVDSDYPIVASANRPSSNPLGTNITIEDNIHPTSISLVDNKGAKVLVDVYFTKTATNTWEVAVFDKAQAAVGGNNSFPYGSGPLTTGTLDFEPTGDLTATSATSVSFTVPGGQAFVLDLSKMTEFAYDFAPQPSSTNVNGQSPSEATSVQVSADGIISANYKSGELTPIYRIGMATVPSPDRLRPLSGNVFIQGTESGVVTTGFAGSGAFGTIVAGALEGSNVDIAEELTMMIESQRNYTANSKVFQTGSELLDVLVNLAR